MARTLRQDDPAQGDIGSHKIILTAEWRLLYTDAGEFPLPPDLEERAAQAGIELVYVEGHDPQDIVAHGAGRTGSSCCHGLFLYRARVNDELLAALPQCRVLARVGTGYELIDVAAAHRRGIMVTNVPEFCTEEMSDTVILFVLAFARRLPHLLAAAHEHRWLRIPDIPTPRRLAGQTLGILGFGRSGGRAAEKARALGLEIRVWTRTSRPEALARLDAHAVGFEEALGCDYVSLHMPLTAETTHLLDRQAFEHFKPTGVLINLARGAIVDTDALVEALRQGRLAGAALDVVDPSPLPPDHPLWDLPNVLITSHSACLSHEALRESQTIAIDDAAAVLQGRPPRHPVPHTDSASRMIRLNRQ
jgi:phosphoglycerate dehydrogenase-like enzyme